MKQRTAIHIMLSIAVAVMLIICGTAFQTNYSASPAAWLSAHRQTPLLWLLDFTAFYTLLLMATLARANRRVFRQAEETYVLREEHHNQLGMIVARAAEVDEINDKQAEKLEQLEMQAQSRQEFFEEEARRLVEQLFLSMQEQVETHTRQLDAVNMALQYHRAELSELRHHLRRHHPSLDIPVSTKLSSAEVAALSEGLSSLFLSEEGGEALVIEQREESDTKPDSQSDSPKPLPPLSLARNNEENGSEAAYAAALRDAAPEGNGAKHPEHETPVFDPTLNAHSTYVLDTAEFQVSSKASLPSAPQKSSGE